MKKYLGSTAMALVCAVSINIASDASAAAISYNDTLVDAAKSGNISQVKNLLENKGYSVNASKNYGTTALMQAAYDGNKDMVKYLISKGADVNAADLMGATPLVYALHTGQVEVAKTLISSGARTNVLGDFEQAFLKAYKPIPKEELPKIATESNVKSSPSKKEEKSAKAGSDDKWKINSASAQYKKFYAPGNVNLTKDVSFNDKLVDAADKGNAKSVSSLISSKYDVNSKGDFQTTALMRAAYRGEYDIAKNLIDGGANVNAADQFGATPLAIAVRSGNNDVAQLLIDNGAEGEVKKSYEKTAFIPVFNILPFALGGGAAAAVAAGGGGGGGGGTPTPPPAWYGNTNQNVTVGVVTTANSKDGVYAGAGTITDGLDNASDNIDYTYATVDNYATHSTYKYQELTTAQRDALGNIMKSVSTNNNTLYVDTGDVSDGSIFTSSTFNTHLIDIFYGVDTYDVLKDYATSTDKMLNVSAGYNNGNLSVLAMMGDLKPEPTSGINPFTGNYIAISTNGVNTGCFSKSYCVNASSTADVLASEAILLENGLDKSQVQNRILDADTDGVAGSFDRNKALTVGPNAVQVETYEGHKYVVFPNNSSIRLGSSFGDALTGFTDSHDIYDNNGDANSKYGSMKQGSVAVSNLVVNTDTMKLDDVMSSFGEKQFQNSVDFAGGNLSFSSVSSGQDSNDVVDPSGNTDNGGGKMSFTTNFADAQITLNNNVPMDQAFGFGAFTDSGNNPDMRMHNQTLTNPFLGFADTGFSSVNAKKSGNDTLRFGSFYGSEGNGDKTVSDNKVSAYVAEFVHNVSDNAKLGFQTGLLVEQGTFLGSETSGAFATDSGTPTSFYALSGEEKFDNGVKLMGDVTYGVSKPTAAKGSALDNYSEVKSTSFSVAAEKEGVFGEKDNSLGFAVSQPLRSEGTAYNTIDNQVGQLTPSGREIDVEAYYATPVDLGQDGTFKTGVMYRSEPGHNASAAGDVVFMSKFGFKF